MTKKLYTSYATLLCMAVMMVGVTTAYASEVTGTLSSDATNNPQTSGSLSGTVSNGNGGSSSGSRSSSRSSGSVSNNPSGTVSGASTMQTQTPGFPNAGFATEEGFTNQTLWSTIVDFLRNIVSF